MPRTKRQYANSGLNHCIIRGVNKTDIFYDDSDRRKFLKVIKECKEKYKVRIGAYALMQNHVHLLTKSDGEELSKFFQSIQISYSTYFNKKYERVGHLFENRYKNKVVETSDYVRNLVKYIHFNPEKAGICKATEYKWSSYNEFIYDSKIIDKDLVLIYYSNDLDEALEIFKKEHHNKLKGYYSNYMEYEMVNKLTDEQVKYIIDEIEEKCVDKQNNIWEKEKQKQVLEEILKIEGISLSQICRVTGVNVKALKKIRENNTNKDVSQIRKKS